MLRKNKKGSVLDLLFIGIVLLFFGVIVLVMFKVISEVNDNVQVNADIPADGKTAMQSMTNHFPGIINNSFLFLTVGLAIVALALAALVRVHPVFLIFFIIALIFLIFFSAIFSNIYQELAAHPDLASEATQLTFITLILTWLPLIVAVFGTILMIVLYKLGGDQGV